MLILTAVLLVVQKWAVSLAITQQDPRDTDVAPLAEIEAFPALTGLALNSMTVQLCHELVVLCGILFSALTCLVLKSMTVPLSH